MPSPVRHRSHGKPHAAIAGWLLNYQVATPGVDLGIETTVFFDGDNEPQPDALLRNEPQRTQRVFQRGFEKRVIEKVEELN